MKILLIGNTGQLGWELERCLAPLGELNAYDFPAIDLADSAATRQLVHDCQPDLVVNAAAYTAVDLAEGEPELAAAINSTAPAILAEETKRIGSALIHYSTDYVFDGQKDTPYLETDQTNPLNVYGRTKLAGEMAVEQVGYAYMILRTSWVYSLRRESYVTKVLQWGRGEPPLKLVTDQVSGPTWARMLAEATAQLVVMGKEDPAGFFSQYRGMYHLAGSGYCSRFDWGLMVLKLDPHKEEQTIEEVFHAHNGDFPTPAQRPLFSALNCDLFAETFHLQLPDWKIALKLAMEIT
jgi:dTDP-4-dehydrorhamnose reductase